MIENKEHNRQTIPPQFNSIYLLIYLLLRCETVHDTALVVVQVLNSNLSLQRCKFSLSMSECVLKLLRVSQCAVVFKVVAGSAFGETAHVVVLELNSFAQELTVERCGSGASHCNGRYMD